MLYVDLYGLESGDLNRLVPGPNGETAKNVPCPDCLEKMLTIAEGYSGDATEGREARVRCSVFDHWIRRRRCCGRIGAVVSEDSHFPSWRDGQTGDESGRRMWLCRCWNLLQLKVRCL